MENKAAPNGTASLKLGEQAIDLPILKGTLGPDVLDIRNVVMP